MISLPNPITSHDNIYLDNFYDPDVFAILLIVTICNYVQYTTNLKQRNTRTFGAKVNEVLGLKTQLADPKYLPVMEGFKPVLSWF